MKILETQSAVLTNVEVLEFFQERSIRHAQERPHRSRGSEEFEKLIQEVIQYLKISPGPLSQEPIPFTSASIASLMDRLRDYQLTKPELIMIVNQRPATLPQLHACIDEIEERLSDDQRQEVIDAIAEVLGAFPPKPEEEGGGEGEGEGDANGTSDGDPMQSIETAAP